MEKDRKIDGKKLKKSEIAIIEKLQDELYSPTTIDQFTGVKTQKMLGILGIKSPALKGAIKVSDNPNTWVVPKEKITDENRAAWMKRMQKKYRLKKLR